MGPEAHRTPRASFLTDATTSRDIFGVCRGRCKACSSCGRYTKNTADYTVPAGDQQSRRHPDNDVGITRCSRCGCLPEEHEMVEHEQEREAGNDAFALGRFDDAVAHYSRAIQLLSPAADAALWSNRAAAYLAKGWPEQALHDAERALALRPEWAKAWGRKGAALLQLSRAAEAAEAYSRGVQVDSTSLVLTQGLAQAQAALRKQHHQQQGQQQDKATAARHQQPLQVSRPQHSPQPQPPKQQQLQPTQQAGNIPHDGVVPNRAQPSRPSEAGRGAAGDGQAAATTAGMVPCAGSTLLQSWQQLQQQAQAVQAAVGALQQQMQQFQLLLEQAGMLQELDSQGQLDAAQLQAHQAQQAQQVPQAGSMSQSSEWAGASEAGDTDEAEELVGSEGMECPAADSASTHAQPFGSPVHVSACLAEEEEQEDEAEQQQQQAWAVLDEQPGVTRGPSAMFANSTSATAETSATVEHSVSAASSLEGSASSGCGNSGYSASSGDSSGSSGNSSGSSSSYSGSSGCSSRDVTPASSPGGESEDYEEEDEVEEVYSEAPLQPGANPRSAGRAGKAAKDIGQAGLFSSAGTITGPPTAEEAGTGTHAAGRVGGQGLRLQASHSGSASRSEDAGPGSAGGYASLAAEQGHAGAAADTVNGGRNGSRNLAGTAELGGRTNATRRGSSRSWRSSSRSSSSGSSSGSSSSSGSDSGNSSSRSSSSGSSRSSGSDSGNSSSRSSSSSSEGSSDEDDQAASGGSTAWLDAVAAARQQLAAEGGRVAPPAKAGRRQPKSVQAQTPASNGASAASSLKAGSASGRGSLGLGSLQQMCAAAEAAALARDAAGVPRAACKVCGHTACPQYKPAQPSSEAAALAEALRLSSEQQMGAAVAAGLAPGLEAAQMCAACGCPSHAHETSKEAATREARLRRQQLRQQRQQQQKERQAAGMPTGAAVSSMGLPGAEAAADRQRRIAALTERRAAAAAAGEELQETDCDALNHTKRTKCSGCSACPGFRVLFRSSDALDPEVMFFCSLCGCRSDQHEVDAAWQAEEERRRASEAAAAAQRRHSAARVAAGSAAAAAARDAEAEAYATLGLPLGADKKTVARAYKRLALRLHPDKQGQGQAGDGSAADAAAGSPKGAALTDAPAAAAAARERFIQVTAAYKLLTGTAP